MMKIAFVVASLALWGSAAPDSQYRAPPRGHFAAGQSRVSSDGFSRGFGSARPSAGFGASSGGYGLVVPILVDNREGSEDGNYNFEFETGDGASRREEGAPTGPYGAVVQRGGWSFTFPDGSQGKFSFVADENGYRVESPLLPVGPAAPPHALAQIEKAEYERAQGIVHDGSYSGGSSERQSVQGHGFQRPNQAYNF